MNAKSLNDLTNAELVGVHNALNPDKPLSAWKGKKDVLVARIEKLRASVEEIPAAAPPAPTTAAPGTSERTIRSAALELLCKVEFYEDKTEKSSDENRVAADHKNARSVGLPYDEIISRIRAEFPDCQTSVACLRWYSVKVRVEEQGYEGLRLPQRRPRVKPAKA